MRRDAYNESSNSSEDEEAKPVMTENKKSPLKSGTVKTLASNASQNEPF